MAIAKAEGQTHTENVQKLERLLFACTRDFIEKNKN